jgi:hypothetical protein
MRGSNVLLAVASTLVVLLLTDLVAARFLPLELRRSKYLETRTVFQYEKAHVRFDPELGFSIRPDLDVVFENPEIGGFSTRVRTNPLGLRDDEASLASPRCLFLGDSFVFGWGVDAEDGVEHRFESLAGATCLNLGVSGYGTLQQLLQLRRHGRDLPRDARVFLFVYRNDFDENVGLGFGVYPRFASAGPRSTLAKPDPAGFSKWLAAVQPRFRGPLYRHSFVAYWLARGWDGMLRRVGARTVRWPPPPPESDREKDALMERVLRGMQAFLATREASLFVCWVAPVTHFTDGEPSGFARLAPILERLGVPYLDTSPLLTAEDYWLLDGHWKPSAHQKVASRLARLQAPR